MRSTTYLDHCSPWRWGVGLCAVVLVGAGCSSGSDPTAPGDENPTSSTSAATGVPEHESGTLFGIAGLIPPNFPDSDTDDWEELFNSFPETGPIVGVYQNWNDGPGTEGGVPDAVRVIYNLAEDAPIVPVVGLGVKQRTAADGLASTVDYDDPDQYQLVIDTLVSVVDEFDVDYLLFGAEINRLALFEPDAFEGFVRPYADAYDAVKVTSPSTEMFTGFQLELMRGDGFLMGGSEDRGPQWDLIDRFSGRLDLLAFTVYPQLDFTDPADIPADYLSSITERFDLPLALTEIGWPSEPIGVAGAEDYGGTEAEQAAFVGRLAELLEGVDVRLAIWAAPYDVGSFETAAFETISLRANDGTPKPALSTWQDLAGID